MKRNHLSTIFAAVLCISGTGLAACPTTDLSGDCFVDFEDFSMLAGQWLADYDSNDLDVMTFEWLTDGIPEPNMTWVSIVDPGFAGQMSKYETTNAQYCEYLNAAKAANQITVYTDNIVYATSDTSHSQPYFYTYGAISFSQITYSGGIFSVRNRDGLSMDNHPVVRVSWYGAMAFCNYYGYRLPSELEWQAVADYDGSYLYGCGTTINQTMANEGEANPLGLTSRPYTSPVGYYPAYGYGMCDMAGNVWEWTSSCYYLDCSSGYRVLRGGSFAHNDSYCLVSNRHYLNPYESSQGIGFRPCR